jgi:ankyrin repeat protein
MDLQAAAWEGNLDVVKILLDKSTNINIKKGEYGSALQTAAWRGHQDIVKILLDCDADVNTTNKEYGNAGRTPLSLAADKGHEAVVK